MPALASLLVLLAVGVANATTAKAPGLAIAEHNACLGCHSIDQSTVGPSFEDIAERYRGVPDAEDRLFAKVKHGGKGEWGERLAMPHHMQVPDEEIRALVRWMLMLSPGGDPCPPMDATPNPPAKDNLRF